MIPDDYTPQSTARPTYCNLLTVNDHLMSRAKADLQSFKREAVASYDLAQSLLYSTHCPREMRRYGLTFLVRYCTIRYVVLPYTSQRHCSSHVRTISREEARLTYGRVLVLATS
jgi:hypothetical protein